MIKGIADLSEPLAAFNEFKLRSGKFLHRQGLPGWQGNFFDHIMRTGEDWRRRATYSAMNPVRAGLVEHFLGYPFQGSIGTELTEVVPQ